MFKIEEAGIFSGIVRFLNVVLSKGCVADDNVAESADIAASKLRHEHRLVYAQASGTTAADETRVVHVVKGLSGTLASFAAGCVTACLGDATLSLDLLVNGASVLSAAISLSASESAREIVEATIASAEITDEDVLEVAVTTAAGTGTLGEGVFAVLNLTEKPE